MRYRLFPGWMGILLVLLSLFVVAWGVWPVGRSTRQATLSIPGGDASLEVHNIELTWPARLRAGDPGVIRLVLESVDSTTDASSAAGRLVESRLEAAGLKVLPTGEILEPLLPGRQAIFYWSVLSEQGGYKEAVAWVSVHARAGESGESGSQSLQQGQLLTAQKIPIRAVELFGLNGQLARLLGIIGLVIGLALCVDGFILSRKRIRKEACSDHA